MAYLVVQKHWIDGRDEWRIMFDEVFADRSEARNAAQVDASRWYPGQYYSQKAYLSHIRIIPSGRLFQVFAPEPCADALAVVP